MSTQALERIDPTLFIGIGGAGGQVLGRLNRLFREEFGEAVAQRGGASPLQFLLLDTDDFEKLPASVRENLGNREQDFVSLSHFNPRRYAERQLALRDSDLRRWFDKKTLPYLEDGIIQDGASRLRMLGRLCLHYHYHEVEQRIRAKIDRATDADVHPEGARIRAEARPLRIFIISSSCGGTGSSIFLDLACIVNRIARDRGTTPTVTGFVLLPFPYIELNSQIDPALEPFYQHNAWAFFEELNYFLRNPERIPEYALDLDRAPGQPPRPFDYGRDIFRTVFLTGNHIPTFGTLELPQLYSYAAHGIFNIFLTPEEGAVQSHYSNIKTKLSEPDRIYDLPKRFATFGYAEFRLRPELYVERLAEAAVEREWKQLIGRDAGPADVAAAADDVTGRVLDRLRPSLDAAREWAPALKRPDQLMDGATDASDLQKQINQQVGWAEGELEARGKELPLQDQLTADGLRVLAERLDARLSALPLGAMAESRVIAAVRERLRERASELRRDAVEVPLSQDAEVKEMLDELGSKAADLWTRPLGFLAPRRNARNLAQYGLKVRRLLGALSEGARQRQENQVSRRVAAALDVLLADGGILAERQAELEAIAASLAGAEAGSRSRGQVDRCPTVHEIPTPDMLDTETAGQIEPFYAQHVEVLGPDRQRIWNEHRPRVREGSQGAIALRRALLQLWTRRAPLPSTTAELSDIIDRWVKTRGGASAGAFAEGLSPDALSALYPMSTPPCPLDGSSLHKADTVARIPVVVWPFDEDGVTRMRVPGTPHVIRSSRPRIAVLQAWYAFSSRALEGVETLRRSYRDRYRTVSIPHIHAEWNDKGLSERFEATLRFSDEDLLHAARALAISRITKNLGETDTALPGIRLVKDERDKEPFYLLEYRHERGQTNLRWRDVRTVDGHRDTWQLVYARPHLNGSPNGNGYGPAGQDLQSDLTAYLNSEVRQRHLRLLAGLERLERDDALSDRYVDAYREYLQFLDEVISEENRRGRELHLPVLERLSDVLYTHVNRLEKKEERIL